MISALNGQSLDQIFRSARTPNGWADRPVEDNLVREIYDLMKWGPTSANSSPARFVWVRSADGKATLAGLAAEPNKPKILKAPSRSSSATIWISQASYQSFCLIMPR
jgi:3-hydroxypropanoate dehydrogenase